MGSGGNRLSRMATSIDLGAGVGSAFQFQNDTCVPPMLTSEEGVEKETEALAVGVDDYIVKPVEPRRLAARVKSVLTRSKERRQPVSL